MPMRPGSIAKSRKNSPVSTIVTPSPMSIPQALEAAQSAADRGIDAIVAAAQGVLMGATEVELDYFAVVRPDTFQPVDDDHRGPARALIAARVGTTRLIDTEVLHLG